MSSSSSATFCSEPIENIDFIQGFLYTFNSILFVTALSDAYCRDEEAALEEQD
jgi:hypothetical protein